LHLLLLCLAQRITLSHKARLSLVDGFLTAFGRLLLLLFNLVRGCLTFSGENFGHRPGIFWRFFFRSHRGVKISNLVQLIEFLLSLLHVGVVHHKVATTTPNGWKSTQGWQSPESGGRFLNLSGLLLRLLLLVNFLLLLS